MSKASIKMILRSIVILTHEEQVLFVWTTTLSNVLKSFEKVNSDDDCLVSMSWVETSNSTKDGIFFLNLLWKSSNYSTYWRI